MMNYSKEDYERIGRAIVDRVEKSKHNGRAVQSVDLRQAVKFGANNAVTIGIGVKSHCPGCGLKVTQEAHGGILEIGFERDPLSLLKP